jgi:hypothetical protein
MSTIGIWDLVSAEIGTSAVCSPTMGEEARRSGPPRTLSERSPFVLSREHCGAAHFSEPYFTSQP